MSLDWYPWEPTSFRKKTLALTLAEDGAYRRLIDEYMILRGPLPDNDAALARLIGVTLDEWMAVAGKVRPYFEVHGGKLVHGRCEEELAIQDKMVKRRTNKAKTAANVRWEKHRQIKSLLATSNAHALPQAMLQAVPRALPQAMQTHSPEQCTSNAPKMLGDATLQDTAITSSFFPDAAREDEVGDGEILSVGSLATARLGGALASQPDGGAEAPAEPTSIEAIRTKPAGQVTRAELDRLIENRRAG